MSPSRGEHTPPFMSLNPASASLPSLPVLLLALPALLCSAPGTFHSPGTVGYVHRLRSFAKPRFQLTSGTSRSLHAVCAKAANAQRFMVSEQ